jgi:hypothetical protein
MDLIKAYEAQTIREFVRYAFPENMVGVGSRIIEFGTEFDPHFNKWAPRWSGVPRTERKARVGGLEQIVASVLYRTHDVIHNLWGLPQVDPMNPEDCAVYKRTQMCGEVAVLTLTEFMFAKFWATDPSLIPILNRRNALPMMNGPLFGLTIREIGARLDGILHQRLGNPPLWVRDHKESSAFVADYGRLLEADRNMIDGCLEEMRKTGWRPPSGPSFRPSHNLDGLELTLWMIDDFNSQAKTHSHIDEDLAEFNKKRRAGILFPPGWQS